jgi:hypothetical protein
LLVSSHYHLDVLFFEKIQDYEDKTLSSIKQEARHVTLDHIDHICSLSISSIHIGLHALVLYLSLLLRIWVYTWIAMLSHVVMRVVQVFSSFVMLSLACVFVRGGLPSVEMWFDHGEDRCYDLSKDGMVETVEFRHVMWIVMLEYAKDQILGVDTSGQHVSPRVRYGMACWRIRKSLVSLSCWKSGTGMAIPTRPQGARGAWGYYVVPNRGKS